MFLGSWWEVPGFRDAGARRKVAPMAQPPHTESCGTCIFRCPEVCDVNPACAFRAARGRVHGDPEAGPGALERHHRYLVAAICRMTGRYDVALDLAQDVFVKALTNLDRFRRQAELTTWLYAIARNRCYDFLRARMTAREVGEEALEKAPPVVDNDALRALEIGEARTIVARLMKEAVLEPLERQAFLMHYAADVPLETVTQRLQLRNRSGAKAQIVSARRKLGRAASRWERREALRRR